MSEHDSNSWPPPFSKSEFGAGARLWRRRNSEILADCNVFKLRHDRSAEEGKEDLFDFYCLEAPDWVNIIPITASNHVVMIEQYRHGSEQVTLEIPGGMVDQGENAPNAAVRELFEETGYTIENLVELGPSRPNPAIQSNRIYNFAAFNVQSQSRPVFDSTEHTTVRLVPLSEIPGLIADGTIDHALVLIAFYKLQLYQSGLIPVSNS